MEKFIAVTMVLLILSMITEKIGNFLKMSEVKWIKTRMQSANEKERERKIQTLSIIAGITVALVAKANIFAIYNGSTEFEFFWNERDVNNGILHFSSTIIGSLFCGLFLSLGSKFFHDLLDMLLQVKNLKRKLVSSEEIKLETIEEYDKYLVDIEPRSMDDYLQKALSNYVNVSSYELDYDALIVNIILKDVQSDLPGVFPFRAAGGSTKLIRVNPILMQ